MDPPLLQSMKAKMTGCRGTQRIISVNYLFGRPLIPYDFLKRIVTSKFRKMRNLMSFFFRLLKMSFWLPKKRSPTIFRKAIRPKVFGKWTKEPLMKVQVECSILIVRNCGYYLGRAATCAISS